MQSKEIKHHLSEKAYAFAPKLFYGLFAILTSCAHFEESKPTPAPAFEELVRRANTDQLKEIVIYQEEEIRRLLALLDQLYTKIWAPSGVTAGLPVQDEGPPKEEHLIHQAARIQTFVADFNSNNPQAQISPEQFTTVMGAVYNKVASHGMGQFFSPDQGIIPPRGEVLHEGYEAVLNVPAGGYSFISAGRCTISIPDKGRHPYTVDFQRVYVNRHQREPSHVNHVILLGKTNGEAKNIPVTLRNFDRGNIYVTTTAPIARPDIPSSKGKVNLLSYTEQVIRAAYGPNCNTGCKEVQLAIVDLNTRETQNCLIDLAIVNQNR